MRAIAMLTTAAVPQARARCHAAVTLADDTPQMGSRGVHREERVAGRRRQASTPYVHCSSHVVCWLFAVRCGVAVQTAWDSAAVGCDLRRALR
jgi:hypothetical protein